MEKYIEVKCFNLKYTLECGQCFRWECVNDEDSTYIGIIKDRVLKLRQNGNKLYILSDNMNDIEEVVVEYFDLNTNYHEIEKQISKIDSNVNKAVKNTTGTRILNQAFFETLMSYIISSNNNIPRISRAIREISKNWGTKVIFKENEYFLFPTIEQLKNVTEEEFKKCNTGFRARYLKNTIKLILDGKFDCNNTNKLNTCELKEKLLTLQGVGPKVADCILLFACDRKEVFPIDVWVERVMNLLYFKEKGSMKKKDILEYANNNFGSYAGIVQQHLFYNIRDNGIEIFE